MPTQAVQNGTCYCRWDEERSRASQFAGRPWRLRPWECGCRSL